MSLKGVWNKTSRIIMSSLGFQIHYVEMSLVNYVCERGTWDFTTVIIVLGFHVTFDTSQEPPYTVGQGSVL